MRRDRRALGGLDDDIRVHIERETQDNLDRGMPPEEARCRALLTFGSAAMAKEDTRAAWRGQWLEQLLQDSRYAIRTLRRRPTYALLSLLTLARFPSPTSARLASSGKTQTGPMRNTCTSAGAFPASAR
jgi:hypothetical protein